jgi:uncharacterized protein (TIGR03437 family)
MGAFYTNPARSTVDKKDVSRIVFISLIAIAALRAQPVTVTATPPSVTFTYQSGNALPSPQTVAVRAGSGTQSFTTAVSGVNSLWLTASPDSGKLPGSLSLRANPTSLSVGTYAATVTVTITGVATPLTIAVTLNVLSAPSSLTLSATSLTISSPPAPPPQTVLLSTNGSPIAFTASSGSPWLTVNPAVGVVLPGEQSVLTITADPTTLNPQAAPYIGKVTVVAAGANAATRSQNITVNFTVNSTRPTIASIWPPALPVNSGAQTITVRGTNFYTATLAKAQGAVAPLATTILSPTALLAVVPAGLLTTATTLNIIASNPAPGGDSTPTALPVANLPVISAVTNVASYAATSISPGELVTIFGQNIGPATPASMTITNGLVNTTLSGVSVTIDSQPAPMLFVSANQVTVQVPYEATVGASKQVTLTNGANPPASSTVTIAAAAPGIFTADGSGSGQAAALNVSAANGQITLNSGATPARPGDAIVLYVTGEGDYNPTLTPRTGLIVPGTLTPLPQLSPLPAVTIGGAAATVTYAGPIPGSILGLLQINATVPAGGATGQAVPVTVAIGGLNAQSNITLGIHP